LPISVDTTDVRSQSLSNLGVVGQGAGPHRIRRPGFVEASGIDDLHDRMDGRERGARKCGAPSGTSCERPLGSPRLSLVCRYLVWQSQLSLPLRYLCSCSSHMWRGQVERPAQHSRTLSNPRIWRPTRWPTAFGCQAATESRAEHRRHGRFLGRLTTAATQIGRGLTQIMHSLIGHRGKPALVSDGRISDWHLGRWLDWGNPD
jgi:hypothetical protein